VISSLRGSVIRLGIGWMNIEVAGIGYHVLVSPQLSLETSLGSDLFLNTAHIIREDSQTLFGFATEEELSTFELLLSVNGVGPKSALAIVSGVGVSDIENAVASEDDAVFSKVSGIGQKTAKLIVVTLTGKILKGSQSTNSTLEIVEALVGLGYQRKAAEVAVKSVAKGEQFSSREQLLRAALQELASK